MTSDSSDDGVGASWLAYSERKAHCANEKNWEGGRGLVKSQLVQGVEES